MNVSIPILSAGVARLPDSQVQLAALGVTRDISVLYESPVIMLLSASVALSNSNRNFQQLKRLMLHLSLLLTALSVIMNFTPLYDVVFHDLLELPREVVIAARPSMRVLLIWPASIAWRRFHQGILIKHGRSKLITYGAIIRLLILSIVVAIGVFHGGVAGAFLGAIALSFSVFVEAVAITLWANSIPRTDLYYQREAIDENSSSMTYSYIWKFCLPLSITDILRIVSRPLLLIGIARATIPELSLAAWSVAVGLGMLMSSPSMAFTEVVVTLERDRNTRIQLRRFILGVGVLLTLMLTLIAFTPLGHIYFSRIIVIAGEVESLAIRGIRILILLPLLLSCRNLYRGSLIKQHASGDIQFAMMANVMILVMLLGLGLYLNQFQGILLGASAMVLAQVCEVGVLSIRDKKRSSAGYAK